MRKIFNNQKGFTFFEVMMAAAVLIVGTLIAFSLSNTSSNSLYYDSHRVIATEIGSNILEDLLNRNFSDPALTPTPAFAVGFPGALHTAFYDDNERLSAVANTYTAYWSVVWGTPTPSMMDITLQIDWTVPGSTVPQTINLETYRTAR